MSIILTGDGVSRGICIGNAIVVNKDNIDYAPSYIDKSDASNEKEKFLNALSRLKNEYKKSSDKIKNNQTITKTKSKGAYPYMRYQGLPILSVY